jgi:hypothetical protein
VPAAASAQRLRRVTSTLNLKKRTFESNEILSHVQRVDFRHGVRSVEGTINGELSPGTYKDFMAAAVRRAYTAVTAITGALDHHLGHGADLHDRALGRLLAHRRHQGRPGRPPHGRRFNAANLNKNLLPLAVTALNLTVMPGNGVALVAEGPIGSSTWTPCRAR